MVHVSFCYNEEQIIFLIMKNVNQFLPETVLLSKLISEEFLFILLDIPEFIPKIRSGWTMKEYK